MLSIQPQSTSLKISLMVENERNVDDSESCNQPQEDDVIDSTEYIGTACEVLLEICEE